VRKNFAIASLVFAWLCANGAVWNAVQVVAWGSMFAGYARTLPVGEALRETFDLNKPCDMCVGLQQARSAENEQRPATVPGDAAARLDLLCDESARVIFAVPVREWPAIGALTASSWRAAVPVPPPRV
jgi:hypothetical protein